MNLFPEIVPKGEGKEVAGFFSTPGLLLKVNIGNGPIRGGIVLGAYLYVVSGPSVYQIDGAWNATLLGALTTSDCPVSVETNRTQVLFSDGTAAFLWDTTTSAFSAVTSFPAGGYMLASQDGYIVCNVVGSNSWYQSALNDASTWDALAFDNAIGKPGNIRTILSHNREMWLICDYNTEVWINAYKAGFTFQKLEGVYIELGSEAAFSAIRNVQNDVMWLSRDMNGDGVVYRTRGYSPQRVSTHAIEQRWKTYPSMENAFAFSYQNEGHSFYVLTFPSGDETWVYDAATNLWHERAAMDSNGQLHRHWANFHAYFNELNIVGDYQNGNLYSLDMNTYTDNGTAKKWIRTWRAFHQGQQPYEDVTFDSLQIDMQKGILVPDGTSPQMSLRWSNDGGHTWSYEMSASVGKTGETAGTVRFRRLGSTSQSKGRDRVFELSSSDVYPTALIGADMDASRA